MQAVLFDMYGVIVPDPHGGLVPFLRQYLPDVTRRDIYALWLQASVGDLSPAALWDGLGLAGRQQEIESAYLNGIAVDPSFPSVATQLRQQYRLALISNDIASWNAWVRRNHALDDLFDTVIVSGDVRFRKPQPEIYQLALSRLQLPAAECVLIDDRETNLAGARALGIHTVLFGREKEAYRGACAQRLTDLPDIIAQCFT